MYIYLQVPRKPAQCAMFLKRRPFIKKLLDLVPGKRTFGLYRHMPIFFLLGAALEFSMINWEAGPDKTNFYKTYKRRVSHELAEKEIQLENSQQKQDQ